MKLQKQQQAMLVYGVVYGLLLLWAWLLMPPDGAMLFSLAAFYLLLPVLSFTTAFSLGLRTNSLLKWLSPLCFWVLNWLMWALVFGLKNAISNGTLPSLDWISLLPKFPMPIAGVTGLLGVILGSLWRAYSRRRT